MTCRLVAVDLDGTILRDDLTVAPRVRRVLQAVQHKGIYLTLASGRSYASMRRWVGELGITAPVISYQGATMTDPRTQAHLYQRTFPGDLIGDVTAFARARQLSLTFYTNDEIYVEHKIHSDAFYERWFGLPYRIVTDLTQAMPEEPIKCIIIGEGPELDDLRPEFERHFDGRLQVVRSHCLFLEGLRLGVTKGAALAWLADYLGVARAETLAIGDAGNDAPMIAWAGRGVAMGNASAEALAVADYVAPTIEEDGAAEALERFCLNI